MMNCSVSLCLKLILYIQWYHVRYYDKNPVNLRCDKSCVVFYDGFQNVAEFAPPCDIRVSGTTAWCASDESNF